MTDTLLQRHRAALHIVVDVRQVLRQPAMIEEDEPPHSGSRIFVLDRDRAERGHR